MNYDASQKSCTLPITTLYFSHYISASIFFLVCLLFTVYCSYFDSFGGKLDDYPHPELDFHDFGNYIEAKNVAAGQVWDPVDKRDKHWIDKKKLAAAYGKKGCVIA